MKDPDIIFIRRWAGYLPTPAKVFIVVAIVFGIIHYGYIFVLEQQYLWDRVYKSLEVRIYMLVVDFGLGSLFVLLLSCPHWVFYAQVVKKFPYFYLTIVSGIIILATDIYFRFSIGKVMINGDSKDSEAILGFIALPMYGFITLSIQYLIGIALNKSKNEGRNFGS